MGDADMGKESREQAPAPDSGVSDGTQGIDRRSFLRNPFKVKTGIKGAVAAGVAWYLGGKDAFTEWIPTSSTPFGNFSILYESHDVGINASDLPKKRIDLLFKEYIKTERSEGSGLQEGYNVTLTRTPQELVEQKFLKPELVLECARRNIPIMFGDTLIPSDPLGKITDLTIKAGELLAGVAIAGSALDSLLSELTRKIPESEAGVKVERRSILKYFGLIGVGAIVGNPGIEMALQGAYMANAPSAIKRIIGRMSALASDFHPEQAIVFFRNALWAHKLLFAGSKLQEKGQKIPEVVCNVGALHGGLEDFLLAGPKVCETVLLAYPKDFFMKIAVTNGGFLSTSVVVHLPTNPKLTPGGNIEWPSVEEQISLMEYIEDQPLEEALIKGLNLTEEELERLYGPEKPELTKNQRQLVQDFVTNIALQEDLDLDKIVSFFSPGTSLEQTYPTGRTLKDLIIELHEDCKPIYGHQIKKIDTLSKDDMKSEHVEGYSVPTVELTFMKADGSREDSYPARIGLVFGLKEVDGKNYIDSHSWFSMSTGKNY